VIDEDQHDKYAGDAEDNSEGGDLGVVKAARNEQHRHAAAFGAGHKSLRTPPQLYCSPVGQGARDRSF
jgi:hypothetical protein